MSLDQLMIPTMTKPFGGFVTSSASDAHRGARLTTRGGASRQLECHASPVPRQALMRMRMERWPRESRSGVARCDAANAWQWRHCKACELRSAWLCAAAGCCRREARLPDHVQTGVREPCASPCAQRICMNRCVPCLPLRAGRACHLPVHTARHRPAGRNRGADQERRSAAWPDADRAASTVSNV